MASNQFPTLNLSGLASKGQHFNTYGVVDDQFTKRYSANQDFGYACAGESLLPSSSSKSSEKKAEVNSGLFMCFILPPLIFAVVYYARAMWIRYEYPWLSVGIVAWVFFVVLFLGGAALAACVGKHSTGDVSLVSGLLSFMCFLAFTVALASGENTFYQYTQTYYDLVRLNSYPNIDPQKQTGQQVMDAGIIEFTKDSRVEVNSSMGFKDVNVYCVAPVTKNGTGIKDGQKSGIDFWAVGLNCCSGQRADFQCGEWQSPTASSGVRVVNLEQRQYFQLAVKKAEAEYGIAASNPIFLHWMGTPSDEVNSLYDDYIGAFIRHVSGFACATLFTVAFASIAFAKL